jgi:TonB-linked SusC/RagA family outer membrane protein
MQRILFYCKGSFRCVLAGLILLGTLSGWCVSAKTPSLIQERIVSGRVTSADDQQSFPGVNILVKGTTIGTVADTDGNFSIRVPSEESILVFTAIGYTSAERVVGTQSVINIALETDITTLSEVVVVGYGTMKKSDVTGSIAQVTAEQLKAMPVQNTLQGLQGRAAGVDISSNVRPGEIGTIRIRGERSFVATANDPLYVLDGIPLQSGGILAFNPIESLNPNDIESVEVLKDASATAIYGSRAANGVVLITTKKGKNGKAQINYSSSVIFEKIDDLAPNFNAAEYADYRRDAARAVTGANKYATPYPNPVGDYFYFGTDASAWESIAAGYTWIDKANRTPEMRPTTAEEQAKWGVAEVPVYDPSKVPTTNWTDYVEQTGVTQNHNISVTVGRDKVKTYLSAGILDQKGTNVGQGYRRYSGMIGIEVKAVDWLTLGATISPSYGIQDYGYTAGGSRGSRAIYEAAKGQLPFAVPYDASGKYIFNPGGSTTIVNPIRDGDLVVNERTNLRVFGSFFAEANLLKGLKYRVNFGPDFRNYRNGQFQHKESSLRGGGSPSSTHYARLIQNQLVSYTIENLLFYDKTFHNDQKVGVTLLQSASLSREENSDMTATDLPYSSQLWHQLGSTNRGALDAWASGYEKRQMLSYMGRVHYALKDRYLLTVSGRWDGSSVLAEGHKGSFFPSFAMAWKVDQEQFLQSINAIDELKVRVGFGKVGNQAIDPYTTGGPLVRVPAVFGNTPAAGFVIGNPKGAVNEQGRLPNPLLKWEVTQTLNVGVDFGLFNDRITGSVDYYNSTTRDLLMDKVPLGVTGTSSIIKNIGKTKSNGIEVSLSGAIIDQPDFKWSANVTFSRNTNEIVELSNGKQDQPNNRWFIGAPVTVFYDYKKIGIWQTADQELMDQYNAKGASYKPGDIRVEDVNNDTIIDLTHDRQLIGSILPKWTAGILNTFSYKNFELSAFVFSRWGHTIEGGGVDMSGQFASRKIDYWTVDNPTNAYPRADWGNGGVPIHYSAMNYQDGSFVKVRYISLAYVFPKAVFERARITTLKVYAQVLNPFRYGKTDFLDADAYYQNVASTAPNNSASSLTSRSFVFGLDVTF